MKTLSAFFLLVILSSVVSAADAPALVDRLSPAAKAKYDAVVADNLRLETSSLALASVLQDEIESARQPIDALQAQLAQVTQQRDEALAAQVAAEAEAKALRDQLTKMRDEIDHVLTLTWNYDSDRAIGFVVERAIGEGGFVQLARVDAQTRAIDDNVQPRYRIAALNTGGLSAWSPTVVRE